MKSVKVKPHATVILQFPAHMEVNAIQHNGILYYPSVEVEGGTPIADDDDERPAKSTPKPAAEKPAPKKSASDEEYTLDDLNEKETPELEEICIEMGINYKKEPGKNSHKKLRELILKAQENAGGSSDDGDAPEEKPKKSNRKSADDDDDEPAELDAKSVKKVFTELDGGDIDTAGAIKKLEAMGVDAKLAKKVATKFFESADMEISDAVSQIMGENDEPEEKPKAKAKGKVKEEPVEASDLEVDDRVKVWWEDNDDYFLGTVIKVGRKVVVKYDEDDSEEPIDPDNNTEIFRITE